MAELPELTILQRQMHAVLAGRRIVSVEITQPKCLNVPVRQAIDTLSGRRIAGVTRHGKWLRIDLQPPQHLLLNLGMGADLWHYRRAVSPPCKYVWRKTSSGSRATSNISTGCFSSATRRADPALGVGPLSARFVRVARQGSSAQSASPRDRQRPIDRHALAGLASQHAGRIQPAA